MALIERGARAIPGERADTALIHFGDGYFYYRHNDREGSLFISLRCTKYRRRGILCQGRAVLSRDGRYHAITRNHTGHTPDMNFIPERELRARILQRVHNGDTTPHAMIVRDEGIRGMYSVEVRSRLPPSRLRTPMFNARAEHMPRTALNLPILGHYLSDPQYQHITRTLDQQDSIYAGTCGLFSLGTVSVVFISRRMMQILSNERRFFVDGTFRKRPKRPKCSQILCISISWANQATNTKHTITVGRVFMQRRTTEAYQELFNFLKNLMPEWDPELVNCDNEKALKSALAAAFPNCRIVPCLWHYAVDVYKFAKELGLHAALLMNWVLDAVLRCLCALPLLPTHRLYEGLLEVGHWARATGCMQSPHVRALFVYIDKEWMSQRHSISVFGSMERTNNVSESAHAALNWMLRQDRPNTYELIRTFVLQEDQFLVDVHALRNGRDASRAVSVSTLYNDARIRNLTDSLMMNRIGTLQFLQSASSSLQACYDAVFH